MFTKNKNTAWRILLWKNYHIIGFQEKCLICGQKLPKIAEIITLTTGL
jgi:hypothetical protein